MMANYHTPNFHRKNKVDEIKKVIPGISFDVNSDGELNITAVRNLATSELNKLKIIMGKDLIKELVE